MPGIYDNDEQAKTKFYILLVHFEISGESDNDEQPQNISFIYITFDIFHFDKLGKYDSDEQL